jgi:hypothetical protein
VDAGSANDDHHTRYASRITQASDYMRWFVLYISALRLSDFAGLNSAFGQPLGDGRP